jgi:diguanylate cyclase (GGDEF)-like protein
MAGQSPSIQTDLLAALNAAGDVVYEWDVARDSLTWTGDAAGMFELDDLKEVQSGDLFHGRMNSEDLKERLKRLSRHFASGARFDCEYRIRAGNGDFMWLHERGHAEFMPDGRPLVMRGVLRAITNRKRAEQRLEYLANYDDLTGHFNRFRLRQAIDYALTACKRFGRTFLTVDIDNIALINDAFGFEIGDAVLSGLAERLDELTAASDIVGRIEGDCFGLLLDHSDEDAAAETAEKIIAGVREAPIKTVVGDVAITVSVGGVVFPTSAQTSFDIMSRAEMALRQAKKDGRNHYVVYQLTEMQRQSLRQDMSIAKEVQEALLDNRLVLAYQPIVDTASGEAILYECLLRMRRPDGQILPAGAFVPVVEQLGLMRQIDRCTLHLAMEELFNDPYVRLTLNISGMTASDQAWLRTLVSYLRGKPEVGSRLTIEITETVVLQDLEESARFVSAVRDLGCAVALDDFGAGYTSFRNLQALAVDMVKIDGAFITDLEDKPDNQLFIRTLLGLARGFNLTTVAECVETEAEAEILKREGVTYLQGYLYGRPELTRPTNNKIISLVSAQQQKPKLDISSAS